jgi:hypothetical protein
MEHISNINKAYNHNEPIRLNIVKEGILKEVVIYF